MAGTVVGASNQSYQILLSNYQTALSYALQERCSLLTQLLQDTPVKELQCIFSALIEHIFGFRSGIDWGLLSLDGNHQIKEFDAVRKFLWPDGPVLKVVYKFIEDISPKFEFPLSCIPMPSQLMLKEGKVPALYANKLQIVNPGIFPLTVQLNAFEFFFFHFAYYIVNPSLKNSLGIVNNHETLYIELLESYLHYFLPTDARAVPLFQTPHSMQHSPILTSSLSSSFMGPHTSSDNLFNRSQARPDCLTPMRQKPSLLKKGTVMMVASSGSGSSSGFGSSQAECWKSETFLLILKEMYLNQNSLDHQQSILDLTMKTFVPHQCHVYTVRTLLKHLHFFFNCSLYSDNISGHGQIMIDSLGRLKSLGMTQLIQREMYCFLKSIFDHWPLDASFRVPLETWLTYIQPWRYVHCDVEITVWQKYMTENVVFYTSLLQQILKRFLRMDFNCPENAVMLYRVTKVFSQRERHEREKCSSYMRDMIMQAERGCVSKPSSLGMFTSYIQRSPDKSFSFRKVSHLESPATYIPLFSEPVFLMVSHLLSAIAAAHQKTQYNSFNQNNEKKSFYQNCKNKLYDFSKSHGLIDTTDEVHIFDDDDMSPADMEKVSTNLELSIIQLCTLFKEVKPPVLNTMPTMHADTSDLSFLTNNNYARGDSSEMNDLSLDDRYRLMNRSKKPDVIYQGNPDLQPVRTFEIAGLVHILNNFSQQLNEKYASDITRMYNQPTVWGKVCRRILAKPVTFYNVEKSSNMQFVSRNPVHLPPRIYLRFLANKHLITYFSLLLLVFYCFGYNPIFTIILLFVFASLAIVAAAVFYPVPIEMKED